MKIFQFILLFNLLLWRGGGGYFVRLAIFPQNQLKSNPTSVSVSKVTEPKRFRQTFRYLNFYIIQREKIVLLLYLYIVNRQRRFMMNKPKTIIFCYQKWFTTIQACQWFILMWITVVVLPFPQPSKVKSLYFDKKQRCFEKLDVFLI